MLNTLLQGEIAAAETYEQALAKVAGRPDAEEELRRIQLEHGAAISKLADHVRAHGGEPVTSSGGWGTWARAVEGVAAMIGPSTAVRALREGEKRGLDDYQAALDSQQLPMDCAADVQRVFLPSQRAHIERLSRLEATL